ncbi:unnamed protein product [Caenorhabditis sp. 36 PRJEB53466]|nr:unnamed protein product [Caenorhabditis sp. 36 PRJEB53466]
MKYHLIFVLFLAFTVFSATANRDCLVEYRCTDDEVCWNGSCVRKDPFADTRRLRSQYGYEVAMKSKRCERSSDCGGLGGGYVCSKGFCRLIRK